MSSSIEHRKLFYKDDKGSIDENYLMLAEAVIMSARHDYQVCATRLSGHYRSYKSLYFDIGMYRQLRTFFKSSCNGLVPMAGSEVWSTLNTKLGVDYKEIEKRISKFEKKGGLGIGY